jgi:hypothetical protein
MIPILSHISLTTLSPWLSAIDLGSVFLGAVARVVDPAEVSAAEPSRKGKTACCDGVEDLFLAKRRLVIRSKGLRVVSREKEKHTYPEFWVFSGFSDEFLVFGSWISVG